MEFSNISKRIITGMIAISFIFTNVAQAVTGITAENRTADVIVNITKSGAPSDLPVASVSDFFDKENIHLLQSFDLSAYTGKKAFLGYGVYDSKEDNCKFTEKPGIDKIQYEATFAKFATFNQHSYGITKNRITYDQCAALGTQFGGYPLTIDSSAENMFATGTFTNSTVGGSSVGNIWVGAKRLDCNTPKYTNGLLMTQDFENWSSEIMGNTCEATKLNVKDDTSGKWNKTSGSIPSYCVVEFENTDYSRPLKMCAPWWKIIREYSNKTPGLYDPEALKRINQADIPIQLVACTQYDTNTTVTPPEGQLTRTAHCTEYYSRTVAPECVRDMHQPQCKVDECGGYIKNACTLKDSATVGKGYVKGEVLLNGVMTEVKLKDQVVTHEFECPPSPPSSAQCIEESSVVIYPKECPGPGGAPSQCDALKACILAASSDNTAIDTCYANYPCVKIYGGRDIPPVLDPVTREVKFLKGKCPAAPISDGSILDFPVNIEQKLSKVCEEYEQIIKTEEIVQNCKLERPFSDYEVDMSITETDNYENNPLCIRMDTVLDSLQQKTITMNITTNGYFRSKLTKVFLDDSVQTVFDGGIDEYIFYGANPLYNGFSQLPGDTTPSVSVEQQNSSAPIDLDCSAFDPATDVAGNITNPWVLKNIDVMNDSIINPDPGFDNIDYSGTLGIVQVEDAAINSQADCSGYAAAHGFSSYLNSYTYSKNSVTGVDLCTLKLNKVGADSQLKDIFRLSVDSIKYSFKTSMTGLNCLKKAICLDGYYNENAFTSLESSAMCEVSTGEGSPSSYMETLKTASGIIPPPVPTTSSPNKEECTPTPTTESASSTLNGVENIFIAEEYLRGGWGYYSNYNMWYPISNHITISTSEFSDKILPIPEMTRITDYLHYHGILSHESHKAKKPDVAAAIVGGIAAGAAYVAFVAASAAVAAVAAGAGSMALLAACAAVPGIGWIIAVVIIIIIILLVLLSKSKNMDRQYTEYHVYKDVPNEFWEQGPYETRIKDAATPAGFLSKNTASEDGGNYVNFKRLTYWHQKTDTGRDEPGKIRDMLKKYLTQKESLMVCGGVELPEVLRFTHPDEISINYGYPSCKWYKPWCTKMDLHLAEMVSNNPMIAENVPTTLVKTVPYGSLTSKEKMNKEMSTVYLGAVNTLVVLVPYAGDYNLTAYNKYDTLLSQRIIHESSFAGVVDPLALKYAQVNFAMSMNLAPGLTSGLNNNACTKDRAVEWGGGVSGVFFETQRTDESENCQKSNNAYVKDQAMTKLYVKPLNMDRGFTYNLTKPMPFPNRVWIATLDNREVRNYRCYEDWPDCTDQQFTNTTGGN